MVVPSLKELGYSKYGNKCCSCCFLTLPSTNSFMPHGHPKTLGLRITKIVVPLYFTTASKEKEAGHNARPLVCVIFLVKPTKLIPGTRKCRWRIRSNSQRTCRPFHIRPRTVHCRRRLQRACIRYRHRSTSIASQADCRLDGRFCRAELHVVDVHPVAATLRIIIDFFNVSCWL